MMHLITYHCLPTTRTASLSVGIGALALYCSNDLLNLLIGSVWLIGLWLMFALKEAAQTTAELDDADDDVTQQENAIMPSQPQSFEGKSLHCWDDYDDDITEITMDESLQMEDDWDDQEDDDAALYRWEYD